jgi:hypothetical protein
MVLLASPPAAKSHATKKKKQKTPDVALRVPRSELEHTAPDTSINAKKMIAADILVYIIE